MPKLKKILSKSDVERAMKATLSNTDAAKMLRVSYKTYAKYASLYTNAEGVNLFEAHKNPGGVGIQRLRPSLTRSGLMIMDVLAGKITTTLIKPRLIKEKIVSEGLKVEECDRCGFNERRAIDQKVPLIFNFRDCDKTNWSLDNIEFLCHNCFFINIGDVYMQNQIDSLEFYDTLKAPDIDFELPEQHEQAIIKQMSLQNRYVPSDDVDENYGNDLISYNK